MVSLGICRSGSTITDTLMVEKASFSSSFDFSASAFSLGALDSGGEYTNGKFSDVHIYVGTAKYTVILYQHQDPQTFSQILHQV